MKVSKALLTSLLFACTGSLIYLCIKASEQSQLNRRLIKAIRGNDTPSVRVLLAHGADPNAVDSDYIPVGRPLAADATLSKPTALIVAIDWRCRLSPGHVRVAGYIPADPPLENTTLLKMLLDKGANVHARNEVNCTPLMLAAWQGRKSTVQLLLQYDRDVNAQAKDGYTALMFAIVSGNSDTVKLLVQNHADVNTIRSKYGETALSLAQVRQDSKMVNVLGRWSAARH